MTLKGTPYYWAVPFLVDSLLITSTGSIYLCLLFSIFSLFIKLINNLHAVFASPGVSCFTVDREG